MKILVLFEIDPDTNEATGTVMPFCSETCRGKTNMEHWAEGESDTRDFGYTPHCEECGKPLVEQGGKS